MYRTDDGGAKWTKMNADDYNVSPKGPYYFSQIRVNPGNEKELFVTQDGYRHSLDGGKTWNAPAVFPRMFGDYRGPVRDGLRAVALPVRRDPGVHPQLRHEHPPRGIRGQPLGDDDRRAPVLDADQRIDPLQVGAALEGTVHRALLRDRDAEGQGHSEHHGRITSATGLLSDSLPELSIALTT